MAFPIPVPMPVFPPSSPFPSGSALTIPKTLRDYSKVIYVRGFESARVILSAKAGKYELARNPWITRPPDS